MDSVAMIGLTKSLAKTLVRLFTITLKSYEVCAQKPVSYEVSSSITKLTRMRCMLDIKSSIVHQQHFWYLATRMIMKSLNSCTDSKRFTMVALKRKDSHSSTARITSGWSSQQLSTKAKVLRSLETSRISNNSYLPVRLTLCGSFRNTWKNRCCTEVVSLISVFGPYSRGAMSSMFIARAT